MVFELTKDEIPIFAERGFYVPIHPRLLEPTLSLDHTIANKVFPQVADEWYEDLQKHLQTAELDKETREFYQRFIEDGKPKISDEYGYQRIDHPHWRDNVITDDRGFAYGLSISRNSGGSLYFNKQAMECETYIQLHGRRGRMFNIPREKALELAHEQKGDSGTAYVYAHHNIDFYPGALFMRNWAILYLNEAMKSV